MVGTTLREIRDHIEQLASDGGEYYVVCARSGERPVPVAGQRFATRTTAADAARATEQYRAALRRYDPQLPYYDPIVCQEQPLHVGETGSDAPDGNRTTRPPIDPGGDDDPLIGFCHDVSGAVFEALSASDHDDAEDAIMDAYLAAAEATPDRNALCLVLLETIATELERHLSVDERTRLLRAAAANLPPVDDAADPVEASLAYLDSLSLIREYGVTREGGDETGGTVWTVSLRGYAMDSNGRRFPTLPIGIDVLRRTAPPSAALGVTDVTALGEGDWELVLSSEAAPTGGLVCTGEVEEP